MEGEEAERGEKGRESWREGRRKGKKEGRKERRERYMQMRTSLSKVST